MAIDRRDFLKTGAASGSLAMLGAASGQAQAAAQKAGPLKITKIDAVGIRPGMSIIPGINFDWTWVRLYTDQGIFGIGESYSGAGHEAHIGALKRFAPMILGKDAADIDRIWQDIFYQLSYAPWGGAETRMLGAINIAQWDILGKAAGMPLYKLLGGKAQQKLQVYNTMNGWPVNGMREHTEPEKLTEFLLNRGIKGVKIYPYDRGPINAAARHGGTFISHQELKDSLDPIQRIRKTAGDEMGIYLDLSSKWNLTCSRMIAHSLEPYNIMYLEDPMLADNIEAYVTLAQSTSIPMCISERLATRFGFRSMFEQHCVGVVMFDVTWVGGISEAKKIASMADTFKIPVCPHTGGGPVLWFSSMHVATSLVNFFIMESVYHLYNDVYPYFIENVPAPVDGFVTAPDTPGLGVVLRQEPFSKGDAIVTNIAEL